MTQSNLVPQQNHSPEPSYSPLPYGYRFLPTDAYQGLDPEEPNPMAHTTAPNHASRSKVRSQEGGRSCWQILSSHDLWSLLFLFLIWGFLCLTSVLLLFAAWAGSEPWSRHGSHMSANDVVSTVALSAIPSAFSAVLNEVLIERCWRRVQYFALHLGGPSPHQQDDQLMAKHLQAANFGWFGFSKRVCKCRISCRDFWTLLSWLLLRFGTTLAIASTQYCVKWEPILKSPNGSPIYVADKRIWWLFVPPAIHALSVFGVFAMWRHSPFALIKSDYNDYNLWLAYQPFVDRVGGGSLATSEDIVECLETGQENVKEALRRRHQPGLQLRAKLKGTSFGLVLMHVPPGLAWLWTYNHQGNRDALWRSNATRFGLHLAFLIQNILYIVALDFITWNLSQEGLCKSPSSQSPKPKEVKHLKTLGKSAGLVLLLQAWRQQRRPGRAFTMLWLFYLQACAIRGLTSFYIVCFQALKYDSDDHEKPAYDPHFWLGWLMITAVMAYPLIILWLLLPFQAPVCEQDGWRWTKLNDSRFMNTNSNTIGFFGAKTSDFGTRATVDVNVKDFTQAKNEWFI